MDRVTRGTTKSEKPSRLQLAIIQWQRQLIAQRSGVRQAEAGSPNGEEQSVRLSGALGMTPGR
jgi:hypothetical protein